VSFKAPHLRKTTYTRSHTHTHSRQTHTLKIDTYDVLWGVLQGSPTEKDVHTVTHTHTFQTNTHPENRHTPRTLGCPSRQPTLVWPIQDTVLFLGLCARINTILCAPTLCLGTPPHPVIAHTIAQSNVSPRQRVIAICRVNPDNIL